MSIDPAKFKNFKETHIVQLNRLTNIDGEYYTSIERVEMDLNQLIRNHPGFVNTMNNLIKTYNEINLQNDKILSGKGGGGGRKRSSGGKRGGGGQRFIYSALDDGLKEVEGTDDEIILNLLPKYMERLEEIYQRVEEMGQIVASFKKIKGLTLKEINRQIKREEKLRQQIAKLSS